MLEGSVAEFSGPLISQPPPHPASSTPIHNGFALAVRGVRFCGTGVKVAPAPENSPTLSRNLAPPFSAPSVSKPAPQRRRSTGGGRRSGNMSGTTSLITTPVPTPLPPDVTSRLKASLAEQRPRFCDRLNAMFKAGANDCDDDKDPYTFVESSTTSDNINLLQRPLLQTIRSNGMVNRKTSAPPATVEVVKPKKRKITNTNNKNSITGNPTNIQPKGIMLTQQNVSVKTVPPQSIAQMQSKPQQQQQQSIIKPQNITKNQQLQQQCVKPQNTLKPSLQQIRHEIASTSLLSTSNLNATSILRAVKFAERAHPRRTSTDSTDQVNSVLNHSSINNNLLTRIPVTMSNTTLAPPLVPLKSVTPEEERTTMNQLQARIARNRVIGKHQLRNNKTTSSQLPIAPTILPQHLSKVKERSLLAEQLLLGIKEDKLTSSSGSQTVAKQHHHQQQPNPQQQKTVTKHFTFPTKTTGSVVTYKKMIAHHPPLQNIVNMKKSLMIKTEIKKEDMTESQAQLQKVRQLKKEEIYLYKDIYDHGLGISENTVEKEFPTIQRHWFLEHTPQSNVIDSEERVTRLQRIKTIIRRRYMQLRKAEKSRNTMCGERPWRATVQAQVKAARSQPNRMAALLLSSVESGILPGSTVPLSTRSRHKTRHRQELVKQDKCCVAECSVMALPLARHCVRHIMYNVDQLLFEHCTAKFADNTQCCIPVFDMQHELPLCLEHARKRDNFGKLTVESKPKKIRKKAKPAAMTRPNKRGKKKRRGTPNPPLQPPSPVQGNPSIVTQSLPQQPKQQSQQLLQQHSQQEQIIAHPQVSLPPPPLQLQTMVHLHNQQQLTAHSMTAAELKAYPMVMASPLHTTHIHSPADIVEAQGIVPMYVATEDSLSHDTSLVDHGSDSEGEVAGLLRQVEAAQQAMSPSASVLVLGGEEELPLEGAEEELAALPLESADELAQQASRLLEDHDDLASVLSQIPAETFNELFNGERTGVYEPTREETEELERALAAVDKDVRSLEKLQRQHASPLGASAPSVLPAELVESILGGHLGSPLDDSLASLSRHSGSVKEEVVIDLMDSQHLVGVHDNVTSYQVHTSSDLHSQLLPAAQDAMIQLDAAVFPPEAMSHIVSDLGNAQNSGTTFLLPQQPHQNQEFSPNDVSVLLHPSVLHQTLGSDTQQLMLTPAAVFGGGAAPPPTPNSVHQPAVANTPPFHHQNGFLQGNGQFDAKYTCPIPSAPSPAMAPLNQFSGTVTPLTSSMGTQTQQHLQQEQQHTDS